MGIAFVDADLTSPSDDDLAERLSDEARANARLIAAAPELLEALQDYVSDWDNGLGPDIARLRAAIAKAEDAS